MKYQHFHLLNLVFHYKTNEISTFSPPDFSWLLLAAPWLLLGCFWLLLAAPDCSWLLLAAPGCSWLVLPPGEAPPPLEITKPCFNDVLMVRFYKARFFDSFLVPGCSWRSPFPKKPFEAKPPRPALINPPPKRDDSY